MHARQKPDCALVFEQDPSRNSTANFGKVMLVDMSVVLAVVALVVIIQTDRSIEIDHHDARAHDAPEHTQETKQRGWWRKCSLAVKNRKCISEMRSLQAARAPEVLHNFAMRTRRPLAHLFILHRGSQTSHPSLPII